MNQLIISILIVLSIELIAAQYDYYGDDYGNSNNSNCYYQCYVTSDCYADGTCDYACYQVCPGQKRRKRQTRNGELIDRSNHRTESSKLLFTELMRMSLPSSNITNFSVRSLGAAAKMPRASPVVSVSGF